MSNFNPEQRPAPAARTQPLLRLVANSVDMQERVETAVIDRHIQMARAQKCPELDALMRRLADGKGKRLS